MTEGEDGDGGGDSPAEESGGGSPAGEPSVDTPAGETGDGTDDEPGDVPLNIAGHEDRTPPGADGDVPGGDGPVGNDAAGHEQAGGERDGGVAEDGGGTVPPVGTPSAPEIEPGLGGEASPAAADSGVPGDGDDGEDPDADADDEEVEPIELLVQLAKDGEIDPWDVDVVQVTEEFLAALDDGDLRQSGRALFYASVLVRMKSDVLLEPAKQEEAEEPWTEPMEAPADAAPAFDPVDSLETEMERRLDRKHVRGSPETLDELVRELREAERGSWWKESREYDTSGSPAGFDRGTQTVDYHVDDTRRLDGEPTAQEVTERTHGEDIEEVIEDVRAALVEHYEAGRPEVLFREVEDAGGSRVQTFLAVLFLANRGEVRLQQDRLFGDLWVQDPTADLGAEGALAD